MTKIARRIPEVSIRRVYLSHSEYEIWYSKPLSLGQIDSRGGYWYTADGSRFASSRDAMRYLVQIYELGGRVQIQAQFPAVRTPAAAPPRPAVVRKAATPSPLPVAPVEAPLNPTEVVVNQNHPAFQQFLDFLDYQRRRKVPGALTGNMSGHRE